MRVGSKHHAGCCGMPVGTRGGAHSSCCRLHPGTPLLMSFKTTISTLWLTLELRTMARSSKSWDRSASFLQMRAPVRPAAPVTATWGWKVRSGCMYRSVLVRYVKAWTCKRVVPGSCKWTFRLREAERDIGSLLSVRGPQGACWGEAS